MSEEQERALLANTSDEPLAAGAVQSMFRELKDVMKDVVQRVSKIEAENRPAKRRRKEESESEVSDTEQLVDMADTVNKTSQSDIEIMADTAQPSEFKGDTPNQNSSDTEDNLLSDIAQDFDGTDGTGPKVSEKLAEIVNKRWSERLDDAKFKSKMDKYDRPENCDRLLVPKVNPEIWANIGNSTKSADLHIANFQKTLTKVGSALTHMTDALLELRSKLTSSDTEQVKMVNQVVTGNADALALLGHLNLDLSLHRRELIKPNLKKEYGALCSKRNPISDFLFGDDLQGQLTSITASNKIGQTTSAYGNGAPFRRYPDSRKGKMAPHNGDKSFLSERRGRAHQPYPKKNKQHSKQKY